MSCCCEVDSEILGTPFATGCRYSPLFTTVHHYSHYSRLFVLFVLFAIRDYSLFVICDYSLFAIRYSGFPDTHQAQLSRNVPKNFSLRILQNFVSSERF